MSEVGADHAKHKTSEHEVQEDFSAWVFKERTINISRISREMSEVNKVNFTANTHNINSRFRWAMENDFTTNPIWYDIYGDMDLCDLCWIALTARRAFEYIKDATVCEKRATPGWKERLRRLKALEVAALEAAADTQAITIDGLMNKMDTVVRLTEGATWQRRQFLDALHRSATKDLWAMRKLRVKSPPTAGIETPHPTDTAGGDKPTKGDNCIPRGKSAFVNAVEKFNGMWGNPDAVHKEKARFAELVA